jgi:hypothetical protein
MMTNATILVFPRRRRKGRARKDGSHTPCEIIPFTGVYRMRIPDEDFLIATAPPAKSKAMPGRQRLRRPST